MNTWTEDKLQEIIEEDNLHIAPFRGDGETYGTPTWIWCVSVDGDLYVRAYNGPNSSWYQAAIQQQAGRIHATGRKWDVRFEPVEGEELNDRINDAYRKKYEGSQYLPPMISDRARAATVRVASRDTKAEYKGVNYVHETVTCLPFNEIMKNFTLHNPANYTTKWISP